MKKQSLAMKALMAGITLALAAYFGLQAMRYFNDPFVTAPAYAYQVEDALDLSGCVVRTEQVLPDEGDGLLRLLRGEGERVSVGGTVAAVYTDQASLDRQAEIDSLDDRIAQLQYAQEAALGVEVTQKLDAQISQHILDYRAALESGRIYDAEKQAAVLRTQVMKRDYTASGAEDLSGQIQELQSQRQALQAQTAGSVRRITAPRTGLYSAVVDGYENVLTPDMLESLTPSALAALRADPAVVSSVGKLVLGDVWYYAASLPEAQAEELQRKQEEMSGGETLYLRFSKNVDRDLPVTLQSVGASESGRVVAVFRGSVYLSQLTLLRQQSAQVLSGSVEGIRVPRESLRVSTEAAELEDGTTRETQVTGVYCVMGREARFKPVDVLYSNSYFALVRSPDTLTSETLRLRPGDEVIVKARDLFDGKVVEGYSAGA